MGTLFSGLLLLLPLAANLDAPAEIIDDGDPVAVRAQQYEQAKLWVDNTRAPRWKPPSFLAGGPAPLPNHSISLIDVPNTGRMGPMALGAPPAKPDWRIVRGQRESVDELELADLLGDAALHRAIASKRTMRSAAWIGGFAGGGSAAILGGALAVHLGGQRGGGQGAIATVSGVSLITAGAVALLVAAITPSLAPEHVLSAEEAQSKCDTYNETLRRDLQLSPTDLRRF